jgi:hypothetical protein
VGRLNSRGRESVGTKQWYLRYDDVLMSELET